MTAADGTTAILALYPADHRATCVRFARSTAILAGAGVPVPRVLAADCERGWMLLQDLGEHTLAELRERAQHDGSLEDLFLKLTGHDLNARPGQSVLERAET